MVICIHATYVLVYTFHSPHYSHRHHTYHTHAMHTSNPHNKYIHATHFTYQSHASQIHLCYIHNPTAPSLVTFPLSKLGLQPQAEKGRVTQAMPRGLVALARMCAPGAALGAGDSPGGAHVCLVCTCACPQEPMCPDTLGMCACMCVCTRAKWAARGARLCVCENPAPTCAGTSALGVRAGGSSTCTALRGV